MNSTLPVIERPSANFDGRPGGRLPDMLILHYTGMASVEESLSFMIDPASRVAAHYLVGEDGTLYRLVDEDRRAWHAGIAHWAGEDDINGCSIGIELQNPGHEFGYCDFPDAQMAALVPLAADIVARYAIPRGRVLGHADVAPGRKDDPGERFDWRRLAGAGIGLWPESDLAFADAHRPTGQDAVRAMQQKFRDFGYGLPLSGACCAETRAVVTAFQRHWRQDAVTGEADGETLAVLDALSALI